MLWIRIHSRVANLFLAALGAFYALAGLFIFARLSGEVWSGAGLFERILLALVLFMLGLSVWMAANAMHNLGTGRWFVRRQRAR